MKELALYFRNLLKCITLSICIMQYTSCMTKIIGENLEYQASSFAVISKANKDFIGSNVGFFKDLKDEILRWQYIDFEQVAYKCLKKLIVRNAKHTLSKKLLGVTYNKDDYAVALAGEILSFDEIKNPRDDFDWKSPNVVDRACVEVIMKGLHAITQHISFVRLIALDIVDERPLYRILNIPCLFLSGTMASNNLSGNLLRTMARFVDYYGFNSTSDQAYSHSERSICLALSEEYGDYKLSEFLNKNTKDICIQIRNLSRMCVNCEHFIYGRDIYFVSIADTKYFVTNKYKDDYDACSTFEKKKDFIKRYNDKFMVPEPIDSLSSDELNFVFVQVKPKNIQQLIPHSNTLVLETMANERSSEIVKIYLP